MTHMKFIISRIWRGDGVIVPLAETQIHINDNLLVVTTPHEADAMEILFGEKVQKDWNREKIDWNAIEEAPVLDEGSGAGRYFAVAGGVAKAVEDLVHESHPDLEIHTARAEGLRECRKLMTLAKAGKMKGCLLEGMACPGGCIAGPGTNLPVDKAARFVEKYSKEAVFSCPTASAYHDMGEELD